MMGRSVRGFLSAQPGEGDHPVHREELPHHRQQGQPGHRRPLDGRRHTVQATNNNPGVFGWIAVWSAGGQDTPEFAAALTKLKDSGVKHYYVGVGTTDFALQRLADAVQDRAEGRSERRPGMRPPGRTTTSSGGCSWAISVRCCSDREERKTDEIHQGLRHAGFVVCLWQALIPASSAQTPASAAGSNPIVSISTGQLRGSLTADGVAVFKNIPFAQPPVGDLRWQEPVPAKAWTGVRDATAFGPMCHQNDNKQLPHSEDCLQLNVWTPTWPMKSSVPVMVWFHGGGNFAGSGVEPLFNGEILARHGVVLVTTNYRLGIFGFFCASRTHAKSLRTMPPATMG